MGKLDEATAYLSGSMEYAQDHGIGWRRNFINLSNEAKLQIHYIDPTNKPGGKDIQIGEDKFYQEKLQKKGKFKKLTKYVHSYRRYDLRFVDISDFLIVSITPNIPQWGTANEIYMAEAQHKPIFAMIPGGLYQMPRWLLDVFDPNYVFENEKQVIDKLLKLDKGEVDLDQKWVLVRKHIRLQQKEYKKLK